MVPRTMRGETSPTSLGCGSPTAGQEEKDQPGTATGSPGGARGPRRVRNAGEAPGHRPASNEKGGPPTATRVTE